MKKIILSLALGALALNAGVLSYAPTTISTATGAATSTTQQLLQNSATTKAVTTATAADIASKTAEETKAILNGDAGKSTRLFGSSAPVITAAPVVNKPTIVTIATGGGGAAGAAGANGMANIQAVCGAENFDDVVKTTFGKIELNRNYVDAYGKTCNLGTKQLWLKTTTGKWYNVPVVPTEYVLEFTSSVLTIKTSLSAEGFLYSSVNSFKACSIRGTEIYMPTLIFPIYGVGKTGTNRRAQYVKCGYGTSAPHVGVTIASNNYADTKIPGKSVPDFQAANPTRVWFK